MAMTLTIVLQGQDEASEGEWSIKPTSWRVVGARRSTHFPSVPYREPKGYQHACQGLHASPTPGILSFSDKAAGSEVISARSKSDCSAVIGAL